MIPGAEEEVEALSDWEIVQIVERQHRTLRNRRDALQSLTRAAKGASAAMAAFGDAMVSELGDQLATETELFPGDRPRTMNLASTQQQFPSTSIGKGA